ncbi:MAG: reductive dehalogenase [Candidatus Aminicenantes bacterium]|nr:reductive dehalogenase [Candidatus Aminicenantes bacterium]
MKKGKIRRRDFLKITGFGAASLGTGLTASRLLGLTDRGEMIESPNEYGPFVVEKINGKSLPYRYDTQTLQRMSEKNNVFSRNLWEPVRIEAMDQTEDITWKNLIEGKGENPDQTRLDYAFMAASWHMYDVHSYSSYDWNTHRGMVREMGLDTLEPWNPADINMTWLDASRAVKHAARFYGASLAGIAKLNPLWLYSDHHSPIQTQRDRALPVHYGGERFERTKDSWYIPASMNRVIALAFEEDFYAIANSPGRLASAATGNGYSRMAFTAATLAEFIRGLGYRALPAGNGVGLSIPMAIDAGLGQLGRMGLLITPKYGPRVRLAKVITDMPLMPDKPIDFGVTEFCKSCMLCAKDCPSGSISEGPQTWKGRSISNNPGTLKWYVLPETCYDYNGFSCSNCKRVCPFTKPNNSWLHRLLRKIIQGRITPANKLMVTLDQAGGYGRHVPDRDFWKRTGDKTITGRESM